MDVELDPRLEADTLPVGRLPLCAVRLQDDARWPWLVLVPAGAALRELEDPAPSDRDGLMQEIVRAGGAVRAVAAAAAFPVAKLNVGALGNVVPQLHVHVIGRHPGDAAGAAPVWGVGAADRYAPEAAARAVAAARAALGL